MDTAHPEAGAETDPHAQMQNAVDAFKAFDNPSSVQPRDERGKWKREQEELAEEDADPDEPEGELEAEGESDTDEETEYDEDEQEEAEEAHPMPPSWGADDAETWESLPPETQAIIAKREGERDRGLQLKLQETANARKEAEARAKEVSDRLRNLDSVIETVEAIYKSPEPDPRAFGYGTQQFNEAAYRAAHQEWQQAENLIAQLTQQRSETAKQQQDEEAKAFSEWKKQHEEVHAPKLIQDVPELQDAQKAEPLLRELVSYAIEQGIPEDNFSEDQQQYITSSQIHLLWKARQFDKLRAAKPAPKKAKPTGPALKPGVSSPRSAQKASKRRSAMDRLTREGSIEAGAAIFKNFL